VAQKIKTQDAVVALSEFTLSLPKGTFFFTIRPQQAIMSPNEEITFTFAET
jgi:hypothetical protein